jgi:membrane-bound metal-dependent hydrolase YbcI (DUF457 family)
MSVLGVVTVFQSPGIDYRLVMLGAVLPVAEGLLGHPWVLHTLLGAVVVLAVTMLATRRRRLLRRRLLGLPIGLFAHLVLDGVWTRSHLFWWPFLGRSFGRSQVPELSRGAFGVVLELAGALALGWCWQHFGLADATRRHRFITAGRLDV